MVNKMGWLGILMILFVMTTTVSASIPVVDPRVLGTWKCVEGRTWIFNADGTGSVDGSNFRFAIFSTKMATYVESITDIFPASTVVSDYVVSTNSRTFVLWNSHRAVWLEKVR